jgi:hypothetical protein
MAVFQKLRELLTPHTHEWEYGKVDCTFTRRCDRCGASEALHPSHDYGDWTPDPPAYEEHRLCTRCGQRGMTQLYCPAHPPGGVVMASGHFEGCKLVSSIDARSKQVCAFEVQFKNAAVSFNRADTALSVWEERLKSRGFGFPTSLRKSRWVNKQPFGATYVSMAKEFPGHDIDACYGSIGDGPWETLERAEEPA